MKQYNECLSSLYTELELCLSVLLLLDRWKSPNHIPIFRVIGHWISPNWVKRETLFEFCRLKGIHSGENIAAVTWEMLRDLTIKHKLLAITGDNASNNDTLVEHLHRMLLEEFDDTIDQDLGNLKPIMRFRSKQSHIRCLAHVINQIVHKILDDLKTGTAKEAQDRVELATMNPEHELDDNEISAANAVVKIRLLVLWISKTPQRCEHWAKLTVKNIQFDVDIWWNSTHDMLHDILRCKIEIIQLIKDFPSNL
jgi:hypothetical protein